MQMDDSCDVNEDPLEFLGRSLRYPGSYFFALVEVNREGRLLVAKKLPFSKWYEKFAEGIYSLSNSKGLYSKEDVKAVSEVFVPDFVEITSLYERFIQRVEVLERFPFAFPES